MAYLAPDPINRAVVESVVPSLRPPELEAVLSVLGGRSLIAVQKATSSNDRQYVIHRLVGAVIRKIAEASGRATGALGSAIAGTYRLVPTRDGVRRASGQQVMATLAPHLDALIGYFARLDTTVDVGPSKELAAEAASAVGLYRRTLSEWAAAEASYRSAIHLSSTQSPPGRTALRRVQLANILRQRGQFEAAEQLVSAALPALKSEAKDKDRRDYAWALTVKGRLLRHQPRTAALEAIPYFEEAMQELSSPQVEDTPETRRQISELHAYLSNTYRQVSKLDLAEKEAVAGLVSVVGTTDINKILISNNLQGDALVATHLRVLGSIWRLNGQLEKAILAHSRALAIFETLYGSNNTDVLRALDSLGRAQREWGDAEPSLQCFDRADQLSIRIFGGDHAHSATASTNAALALLELGLTDSALARAERGVRIYRAVYSEEHSDGASFKNEATAWAIFVRATALAALGQFERAFQDHVKVLEWRMTVYGSNHAHVASSHHALGDVLWAMGGATNGHKAREHYEHALSIRLQIFGSSSSYWLAHSQAKVGDLTADAGLLKEAISIYRAQLKPGHWRTKEAEAALNRLRDSTYD
jgi:tetratricopeptide (TPR) repeat protein